MNETIKTIKDRRSIRKFTQQPVNDVSLQLIVEAGINAPNAQNRQSWHFTVIRNQQVISELIESAREWLSDSDNEALRERAQSVGFDLFYNAPVNIVISADEQDRWSQPNCAAAVQNMLLAAESIGLGACWKNMITGLLNSEKGKEWKEKLGIPTGYRPYFGVVIGYKAEESVIVPSRRTDCISYI